MNRSIALLLSAVAVLGAPVGPLAAQEQSAAELAKAAQNPLANMMSFPFQLNSNYGMGSNNRTQSVLNIQPVLPFAGGRLITRTIIPIVWQPDLTQSTGTSTGLGDMQFTAFYSPALKGATFGFGPILSMPTGGADRGSQKWSIGPSAVLLVTPGQWVVGALINNVWSFAGEESRSDLSQMLIQPFLNYNFGTTGWYLSAAPIITANWKADDGNQWTVPLGGTIGKLSRVGRKGIPVNLQGGAFYNVVTPEVGGAEWSTRFMIQVMIPK